MRFFEVQDVLELLRSEIDRVGGQSEWARQVAAWEHAGAPGQKSGCDAYSPRDGRASVRHAEDADVHVACRQVGQHNRRLIEPVPHASGADFWMGLFRAASMYPSGPKSGGPGLGPPLSGFPQQLTYRRAAANSGSMPGADTHNESALTLLKGGDTALETSLGKAGRCG